MLYSKTIKDVTITAVVSILLSNSSVSADEWKASVKVIDSAVESAVQAMTSEEDKIRKSQVQATVVSIKRYLSSKKLYSAVLELDKLRHLEPSLTESSLSLSEKLMAQLVKDSESDMRKIELVYEQFAASLLKAKKPSDIDQWFVKFQKMQNDQKKVQAHYSSVNNWSPKSYGTKYANRYPSFTNQVAVFNENVWGINHSNTHVRSATQIAQSWQDYLQYNNSKNYSSAASSMRNVANYAVNFTYISRSEVLALQAEANKSYANSAKNTNSKAGEKRITLEEIRPLLKSREGLLVISNMTNNISSSRMEPEVYALRSKISDFSRSYARYIGGDFSRALAEIKGHISHPLLSTVAKDSVEKMIKSRLKIPATFLATVDESSLDHGHRYIAHLVKKKSWVELRKMFYSLEHCYHTNSNQRRIIKADTAALDLLIAGKNLEKAKQYVRAIVAYRQALSTVTTISEIIEDSTESLLKLQKEFPDLAGDADAVSRHTNGFENPQRRKQELIGILKEALKN